MTEPFNQAKGEHKQCIQILLSRFPHKLTRWELGFITDRRDRPWLTDKEADRLAKIYEVATADG